MPRAGVLVRAKTADASGITEIIETRTNADGDAEMVLTEWIARPGAVSKEDAQSKVTPHQISVIGDDGEVLVTVPELAVSGKDLTSVVVELQ